MKALLFAVCLGLLAQTASAYWIDTPLDRLAADSDIVVIGRVVRVVPDTNTLKLSATLRDFIVVKGAVAGDTVSFEAPFALSHCVILGHTGVDAAACTRTNPYAVVRPIWRSANAFDPDRFEIITPNSFVTNEYCAVLLRKDTMKPGLLSLVSGDDGKYAFDPTTMWLQKPMTAKSNAISFLEFVRIVQASPTPALAGLVLPTYGPFLSLTNLPATLILPRAITR